MFLINKYFFKNICEIIDINLNNLNIDYNINEKINEEFNKNRIEIMEMGKITIINDPCDIKEELDFINEDILIKLGFKKEDLNDKELNMIKIDNNIFQIIFKDNHRINIINKEDKQEISIIEKALFPNDQIWKMKVI